MQEYKLDDLRDQTCHRSKAKGPSLALQGREPSYLEQTEGISNTGTALHRSLSAQQNQLPHIFYNYNGNVVLEIFYGQSVRASFPLIDYWETFTMKNDEPGNSMKFKRAFRPLIQVYEQMPQGVWYLLLLLLARKASTVSFSESNILKE